ncbi:MAG TPA: HIT family protein [Acidimicrobiales bacterium]|nr:HIT family protein [Acidimicrobiales bacterium]
MPPEPTRGRADAAPDVAPLGCYSCEQEALGAAAEERERILVTATWRVAHAFNSSAEGWLILLPRRHVETIVELTAAEAADLGPLVQRVSRALHDELGCEKTYLAQFSEAEGFRHLHFHVVARRPGAARERLGPNVFEHLRRPEAEWVTPGRQRELALSLRARLDGA